MATDGYTYDEKGYNKDLKDGATYYGADGVAPMVPIGGICGWAKTLQLKDSGTTTGTTADKLVDSGATFVTDGVAVGSIVLNTTDGTEAYVSEVLSETELSLSSDIFESGEAYSIYTTPFLSDAFVECNGQTLSDADSPMNGATIPDYNGTQRFLRGSSTSGSVGGEDTHTLTTSEIPSHTHTITGPAYGAGTTGWSKGATTGDINSGATGGGGAHNNMPAYAEVVWVMRVK